MAGRLNMKRPGARIRLRRPTIIALAGLAMTSLTACVSTETLYADYDGDACRLIIEQEPELGQATATATATLRTADGEEHVWQPAIYFDYDSAALNAEGRRLVEQAADVLVKLPALNVGLQGFTDSLGGDAYNLALADRRVETIIERLIERGVGRYRIAAQPVGEGLPEFGRDASRAHAVNRRVELMPLDRSGRPLPASYRMMDDLENR